MKTAHKILGAAGYVSIMVLLIGTVRETGGRLEGCREGNAQTAAHMVALEDSVLYHKARQADRRAVYALGAEFGVRDLDTAQMIYQTATEAGLSPRLWFAQVREESHYRTRVVSSAGAIGIAQVKLATARTVVPTVTREELFDLETNLRIGATYMARLLDRYAGDYNLALRAYNEGPTRLDGFLAQSGRRSSTYSRSILEYQ